MTEHDRTILAVFTNIVLLAVMLGSGIWVAVDATKRKRPVAEIISWFLFATVFIIVGPVAYFYFRKHFYR
ncbi:MAG: PLDc N-terminal domain-containing protein [Firmicutes bacterium]|nr:PLDc N-terminal domain-containing protein [Bacillota bacterium]